MTSHPAHQSPLGSADWCLVGSDISIDPDNLIGGPSSIGVQDWFDFKN